MVIKKQACFYMVRILILFVIFHIPTGKFMPKVNTKCQNDVIVIIDFEQVNVYCDTP